MLTLRNNGAPSLELIPYYTAERRLDGGNNMSNIIHLGKGQRKMGEIICRLFIILPFDNAPVYKTQRGSRY
jgi:hypothetical protein